MKILSYLLALIMICSVNLFGQSDLNNGLVAYYPMNGNANDQSGNSNNGYVNGAALTNDRFNNSGGAYFFDGINDYIYLGNDSSLYATSMSVTQWMYLTGEDGVSYSLTNDYSSAGGEWGLWTWIRPDFSSAAASGFGSNNHVIIAATDTQINDGKWHFFATVHSHAQKTISLYIDGVLRAVNTIAGESGGFEENDSLAHDPDLCPWVIGVASGYLQNHTVTPAYFKGKIDDVRIYNRVLTAEEIETLTYTSETCTVFMEPARALPGDTLQMPVWAQIPPNFACHSLQMELSGYMDAVELLNIETDSSLSGTAGWSYEFSETDSLTNIWMAGANTISGNDVLFWMKFFVHEEAQGYIPIIMDSVLLDTDTYPLITAFGGIQIFTPFYGDVDLNNRIQAYDAALILQYLAGSISLDSYQISNADVTLDTTVSGLDASYILQYGVGILDELPHIPLDNQLAYGSIHIENQYSGPGKEITLPLHLNEASNIFAFDATITFDPNDLQFESAAVSEEFRQFLIESNVSNNLLKICGAGPEVVSSADLLAYLRFELKDNFIAEKESTTVVIESLRWNEDNVQETHVTSIIYNSGLTNLPDMSSQTPKSFNLKQNYPNPFNPMTTIAYEIPVNSKVELTVYNLQGQNVCLIVDKWQGAGSYRVSWDGKNFASGVYYYRLKAGSFVQTKKFLLIR